MVRFCTNFIVFFLGFEILISWVVELLEKVLAFSLKLDLLFPHQTLAEEVVFCVFKKKKQILSWNCNIFLSSGTVRKSSSILFKTRSWVVDFLESILAFSLRQCLVYSHQSLAEEWLFFVFLIKKEVLVVEENSGLHKRIIFMNLFHESFPILVFEESLSIEIAF